MWRIHSWFFLNWFMHCNELHHFNSYLNRTTLLVVTYAESSLRRKWNTKRVLDRTVNNQHDFTLDDTFTGHNIQLSWKKSIKPVMWFTKKSTTPPELFVAINYFNVMVIKTMPFAKSIVVSNQCDLKELWYYIRFYLWSEINLVKVPWRSLKLKLSHWNCPSTASQQWAEDNVAGSFLNCMYNLAHLLQKTGYVRGLKNTVPRLLPM